MSQYYLMAQLPSLDGINDSMPLPITEALFTELCQRFLGKKWLSAFQKLTLSPPKKPEKTGSALLDKWCEGERCLRLALGQLRAEKQNKAFEAGDKPFSKELLTLAEKAVNMTDPLEAEKYLCHYRLGFLEGLRPGDPFAEDTVFYYGLKLKLMLRLRSFDRAAGEMAYQTIYHSIVSGEEIMEEENK